MAKYEAHWPSCCDFVSGLLAELEGGALYMGEPEDLPQVPQGAGHASAAAALVTFARKPASRKPRHDARLETQ